MFNPTTNTHTKFSNTRCCDFCSGWRFLLKRQEVSLRWNYPEVVWIFVILVTQFVISNICSVCFILPEAAANIEICLWRKIVGFLSNDISRLPLLRSWQFYLLHPRTYLSGMNLLFPSQFHFAVAATCVCTCHHCAFLFFSLSLLLINVIPVHQINQNK